MTEKNVSRIKALEAEVKRLRARLVKAEAARHEQDESRRAMLYMLEDLNESNTNIERGKQQWVQTFDAVTDPIFLHDMDGNIIRANRAYAEHAGIDIGEIIGRPYWELFPKADGPLAGCHKALGKAAEEEVRTPDGKIYLSHSYVVRGEKGQYACSVHFMEDITERKHADDVVRKLSRAIEQAGESILVTDQDGIIEYVNPAFTKLTGYSAEEAIGQTPRLLKSGSQDAAFYEAMWKTLTSGKVWHGKVIDRKKDGCFYPAMLTISPIHDESGDITHFTHFVGIQSDLSELEDLEQQFHQAQKMEALGTLVGGIAHDFNNMLASITGNLYLAKKKMRKNPDVIQKLVNVEDLSFRAADMIQQLLTFARKGRVSMKPLPFTPFIKETLKFLHTSVPENIDMRQDICSDDLQINGDGTQLHQVLMNLVNNARDALEGEDEPCITIRLEKLHTDDAFIETHAYFTVGDYAHLSVEDNGCGIPKHQIEHLFEPFFTTKEQGKGTGLGLAMVFGAAKTHHGFVEVDSSEGSGSTFHIYLPLLELKETASDSSQEEEVAEGHGETILLVDDQLHIIETGREVLESLGYKVLTATDGRQAVDMFKARFEEIDICIFDIVMPIMGGDKAAQSIRRINPEVKIIFSTGYDKNLQSGMEHETVLNKPFSIIEMSHLIRRQLDG